MKKSLFIIAATACAVLTGCFDNRERPQDALPVTSLAALAATNRADVVRLYLRGGTEPLVDGSLKPSGSSTSPSESSRRFPWKSSLCHR